MKVIRGALVDLEEGRRIRADHLAQARLVHHGLAGEEAPGSLRAQAPDGHEVLDFLDEKIRATRTLASLQHQNEPFIHGAQRQA